MSLASLVEAGRLLSIGALVANVIRAPCEYYMPQITTYMFTCMHVGKYDEEYVTVTYYPDIAGDAHNAEEIDQSGTSTEETI